MYAIIETGGKQYRVAEGAMVQVERLDLTPGATVTFDRVLLVGGEGGTRVGTPVVPGATVTATVMAHGRSRKILVLKYKPKSHYRRRLGHRQAYTLLRIDRIEAGGR
ncbi:MAG: 50S ribosomal protein L21 [Armatimonadota bacterium]|nr:50S ribosomal protein L21 [Armatimonadota bacterium]MDR7402434.1 50S ribosomal protein L21 [Armatimonadota bacterium]MDR7404226.1 50S ribosomal protein L21 [Armatimonadota bacterium]MDR7437914.1 50S ribosomal protein L21 [Armatimonadota bacterium]MDR7472139.1 50S ribosomal protein L21 [Armatimonadota bacterium]